jgi:hypothetical protein
MMMPRMNNKAIERAEKVARKLEARRTLIPALEEAKGYKKPRSLSTVKTPKKPAKVRRYEFTDRQLEIAMRSLNEKSAV